MSRLCLIALIPLLLAACGIKGDLKTPPPLFGEAPRVADIEEPQPPLAEPREEDGSEDPEPFYGPDFGDTLRDEDPG